ncbi:sensor histidine kinase [Puia dinghuensis]|uniref:Signal transduction histidine kinase internal region domain-containing protein n=1 Tax=Puia dinghuensis TaxID=1792502 RepID=A0A8J2U8L4_9BACT|nr:sensor histidine kinase [Puia dinghuensis]GGA86281.1 hypothetical protein GCM10011511_06660 [Puia dinghuensis]
MKDALFLTSLLSLLLPVCSFSQEYSYTHYDVSAGLAGSVVYCITQDKDGFIWVGTETGVSRFDGTHFRNFTTVDGLPDIEVLIMFTDTRGRVWMAPFSKSVCYYYKGKIYNQDNDPFLHDLHFTGNVQSFAEDAAGNILIQESSALHLLGPDGHCTEVDSIHHRPLVLSDAATCSRDGNFLVQEMDSIYEYRKGVFTTLAGLTASASIIPNYICLSGDMVVWRTRYMKTVARSLITGEVWQVPHPPRSDWHVSYTVLDDTLIYINQGTGTTEYDLRGRRTRRFLPGVEISRVFRDDDGNTWFTTIGQGIYRLNSDAFRKFILRQPQSGLCSVFSIKKIGDQLLVGTNRNSIFRFHVPDLTNLGVRFLPREQLKRILYIDTLSDGRMLYGSDFSLEAWTRRPRPQLESDVNVKGGWLKNDRQLLVASSRGAFLIDLRSFRIVDTLCKERTTTLYYHKDTTYIGTLNGLYRLTGDHQNQFLGKDIPFLRKRIAAIVESNSGIVWIASYDEAGIVGIKDGRVVRRIGQQQGLTSDLCRTLTLQNDYLWVGTDKGLNRIDLAHSDRPIVQYTAYDGLASNVINTVCVDSPMVYVGTPAGLSAFNSSKADDAGRCRLSWLDITVSGAGRMGDTNHLQLSFRGNNIHFEYAGISYRSADNITYEYRLAGLDTAWRTTRQTFLDYPTLPSGEYDLQITAINKSGVHSRPLSLHFVVATPFWRTAWFIVSVLVCVVALTWVVAAVRIKRFRTRQLEEQLLVRKMSEMKHMALQSQMNPHFIFNCLNSIQQFIFDQDIFSANRYITGFSQLIRATLQHSSQSFIPLAEEINYLSTYLSLEKLRFKDKMNYSIETEEGIDTAMVMIPPMIVQPYVENSVRHGLRHKQDGKGHIRIHIRSSPDSLIFVVEDNGIGREKAAGYKTVEHIEYQSRGTALTAERIGLMNTLYGEGIGVEIVDLSYEDGRPAGTRVVLRFPLFVTTLKKDKYDPNRLGR